MLKSIRAKLTLLLAGAFGLLLISFVSIVYFSMNYALVNTFDKILLNGARNLEFLVFSREPHKRLSRLFSESLKGVLTQDRIDEAERVIEQTFKRRPLGEVLDEIMERVFFFQPVYAQVGKLDQGKTTPLSDVRVIARSASLKGHTIPLDDDTYNHLLTGEPDYQLARWGDSRPTRVVSLLVRDRENNYFILQVGMTSEEVRTMMNRLRIFITLIVPIILALVAIGGYLFVRRAFRPVDRIVTTVNSITSEDLSLRVESSGSTDEIGRLTDTFNSMIHRLEKSFKSIKEFAGNASHELKTPLTVIRGEIEVALRKDRNVRDYRDVLATINKETVNLQAIVDDLLLLSRIDAGSVSFSLEKLSLDEALLDAYEENCGPADQKGIKIILRNIDPVTIEGNRTLLRRMFSNLLQNAVKYTEAGGTIEIALSAEIRGAACVIADTGIGIPQKNLPRIFDSFYRVSHTRFEGEKETGGAGLGLTIVKRIVELHEGDIRVQSKTGEGTSFSIYFNC